jgi:hypothetical protein
VVDPVSVAGTDPLQPKDLLPDLNRFLVSEECSAIKWFGVVVPLNQTGGVAGGVPHIFFTPSPGQHPCFDFNYDQFLNTSWTELWDKYTSAIGSQISDSHAAQTLVIPIYKNAQAANLEDFLTNWQAAVSAVVTAAINALDPLFLCDTYTFDSIFSSSFSNGIVTLQNFHTQGSGVASMCTMSFNLDGQASGSTWNPTPAVVYRNTGAPGWGNPDGMNFFVGGRWAQIRPSYPGASDHNLCSFLLLPGGTNFGKAIT